MRKDLEALFNVMFETDNNISSVELLLLHHSGADWRSGKAWD